MVVAFGKYHLLRKLGTGGMGEVFLASAPGAGGALKRVVVKRILPHLVENEEFLELFLGEARTAARLNHPNISQIYELGDVDGSWYLAMEYLAGHDLRSIMQTAKAKKKPIPLAAACRIAADAAAGLDYAHKAKDPQGRALGIVHRDVSPHNILVGYDGTVKLIDFGVAKAADRIASTEPGQLRGKYPYMTPEQVEGEPTGPRSDLFSLGVVLWEMLTGKRLFKGESDPATLSLVLACKVKPPHEVRPSVGPEVSAVVMRALEKNPVDRFADLAGFQQALEPFAAPSVDEYMRELYPYGDPGDEDSRPGNLDPHRTQSRRTGPGASLTDEPARAQFDAEPTVSVKVAHLLKKLGARRSSFPPQADAFLGRAAEQRALLSHLETGARLITLFGPPGTGKTRLACHFALSHPGRFASAGGVWFCDLKYARGPEDLCLAVARALEVPLEAGGPHEDLVAQVGAALSSRKEVLLVLDGFDPLLSSAPATLSRWLAAAPLACFLVTSHEPLRIEGERRLEIEALEPGDAAHLFRDRALAARPSLRQTLADEQAAADLLKQLERLPLAIELAAAWVAALSPSQLLQRLPRHFDRSTLVGVIDWSWSLLSAWEQAALAQAAVFRGGFTLEAAEAVLDLSGIEGAPWVLDAVQSLRDHALVRAQDVAPAFGQADAQTELRFSLDPSVREYALEKLTWLPSEGGAHRRYAAYYLAEGAKWAAAADGPDPAAALSRLFLERENLLAVFERAMADTSLGPAATHAALQAAMALSPLAMAKGPVGAHLARLDAALGRAEAAELEPPVLAQGLRWRGLARQALGQVSLAVQDFESARTLASEGRDRSLEGSVLPLLGGAYWRLGALEKARGHLESALPILRERQDARAEATALARLGSLEQAQRRPAEAIDHYVKALALLRHLSDARGVVHLLGRAGAALADAGKLDEAERTIAEAEAALQSLADPQLTATLSLCRGHLELALARAEAKRGHEEAARAAADALTERITRVESLAGTSEPVWAAVLCLRGVLDRAPGS